MVASAAVRVTVAGIGLGSVDSVILQARKGQLWLAGPNVHNPSHRGVAVLAPVAEPAVAGLAEHTVPDGAAIGQGDGTAACCIGGNLESLAAQLALSLESSLRGGQVKQPLSTVAANHLGVANGHTGHGHSHHGGDAGAGQTVGAGHDSRKVVGASLAPVNVL